MLRKTYDWTISLAQSRHAYWALFVVAFIESSVFPIPPDVLIIPMIIARPHHAWRVATVALVGSVLGGMLGYAIGAVLFQQLGEPILQFYGKMHAAEEFAARFNHYGAWAVLIAGITPFPYKVITIVSGWTHLNLWVFMIASVLARGARFFVIAALLRVFGAPVRDFIERRLGLVFTLAVLLLIGGFATVRYL
ncbi:cytochrome B561 [Defluviimonas sp. 20V17]|uniref:Cytochrome b561 n=1 Tax=Allgaiera indica TaxID=765699 RepID=A0AAN4UUC8_9RHOB|nr:YqaA family protein [Allgaiera indica]KDB05209.1 cytochrome B561 [Defluviimonas sp. 20V17]GHE04934.1 cytochrome b561 [Allgaiera indica]SDX59864.1 membrane protein YqaA, SNARE-associated domain [Allgaiera indica]